MFDSHQVISCFAVLFAVIDIVGAVPMILRIEQQSGAIKPFLTTVVSFALMVLALYAGESFLHLFGVDVNSFAVAGSLVLFFIAMEMILGIKIFRQPAGTESVASVVPLAFPIIAGAGTFSTLISLGAAYDRNNILLAVVLNMIPVYVVLKLASPLGKKLGNTGILVMEKMFGIILLAIAVKLFSGNISFLLNLK